MLAQADIRTFMATQVAPLQYGQTQLIDDAPTQLQDTIGLAIPSPLQPCVWNDECPTLSTDEEGDQTGGGNLAYEFQAPL